jgi:hypothetical protein
MRRHIPGETKTCIHNLHVLLLREADPFAGALDQFIDVDGGVEIGGWMRVVELPSWIRGPNVPHELRCAPPTQSRALRCPFRWFSVSSGWCTTSVPPVE